MDGILDNNQDMKSDLDEEHVDALKEVKGKRSILKMAHKMNRHKKAFPRGNQTLEEVTENMESKGIDSSRLDKRVRGKLEGV